MSSERPIDYVKQVVESCIVNGAHTVTKFLSPKLVVKATQRLSQGKIPRANENIDIVLTMGRPNYADALYIKQALKAGEPFPVKRLRSRFPKAKPKVRSFRPAKGASPKAVKRNAAHVLSTYRAKARRGS